MGIPPSSSRTTPSLVKTVGNKNKGLVMSPLDFCVCNSTIAFALQSNAFLSLTLQTSPDTHIHVQSNAMLDLLLHLYL